MKALILFEILLMLGVIRKQRFLHQKEIMQYLQNYIYQYQVSSKTTILRKPTHFFTGCSILSYFFCLNSYNFCIALTKWTKLYFFKITFYPLKRGLNLRSKSNPAKSNSLLKIFKNYVFFTMFLLENVKDKALCFFLVKNIFHVLEFEVTLHTLVKIMGRRIYYFVLLIRLSINF